MNIFFPWDHERQRNAEIKEEDQLQQVQKLLSQGYDPNIELHKSSRRIPLTYAIQQGKTTIVSWLLQFSDLKTLEQNKMWIWALQHPSKRLIQILIEAGADPTDALTDFTCVYALRALSDSSIAFFLLKNFLEKHHNGDPCKTWFF